MGIAARTFGAAALARMGLIAAELAIEAGTEQGVPDAAPQPLLPDPSPPQDQPEHRDQSAARVLVALARPLFTSDRRPPSPDASPVVALNPLPRLTGTLVSPGRRRAIFVAGDKPVVVMEGSLIDAWTVQAISAGSVTLAGPDGSRVLRVSFVQDGPAQAVQVMQLTRPIRPLRTHNRVDAAVRS